jgi:uncharacterized membrane protein
MSRLFGAGIGAILAFFSLTIASFLGWVTHVVYCFQNHEWFLLIAGAILAPIGVIHGWGLWFHWWY